MKWIGSASYGNLIFMTVVYVAVFMVFMALGPAHAQRCPAGADAFGSCLPLDHRYGGPGEIQRWKPTTPQSGGHDISNPSFQKCMAADQARLAHNAMARTAGMKGVA
jgi:hypothetical protein